MSLLARQGASLAFAVSVVLVCELVPCDMARLWALSSDRQPAFVSGAGSQ